MVFDAKKKTEGNLHNCTGWCRNAWDGSVVMEIQREPEAIDAVIAAIASGQC